MGAWSEESFGNDMACDWAGMFSESPSIRMVEETIDVVLNEAEYLESDEACECIAACEVVARLKGNWGLRDAYSESIDRWVETSNEKPDFNLVDKAIDRIMSENSELLELWSDSDDFLKSWKMRMDDLRARVSGYQ